jgi:integrase
VAKTRDGCVRSFPFAKQTLPVVPSPEEVVQCLECVKPPKARTILTTCYAAGLRISEAIRLTISVIDSRRMVIRVEQGKRQKDRYVMPSPKLLDILRDWWRVNRPRHRLFPGDRPDHPITRSAVEQECQKVHRRCRIPKPSGRCRHCSGIATSPPR